MLLTHALITSSAIRQVAQHGEYSHVNLSAIRGTCSHCKLAGNVAWCSTKYKGRQNSLFNPLTHLCKLSLEYIQAKLGSKLVSQQSFSSCLPSRVLLEETISVSRHRRDTEGGLFKFPDPNRNPLCGHRTSLREDRVWVCDAKW